MHADKDGRNSLTYDLIEPARPILDRWFFDWLAAATFSKRDFLEDGRGGVRIMRPLSSHLAMTSALWRGIAEQLAGWFYQCLETGKVPALRLPAGDLVTDAKRRAVRWALGHSLQKPIPILCRECGKALIGDKRRKFCSHACVVSYHGGAPVEAGLVALARARALRKAAGERVQRKKQADYAMTLAAWRRLPARTPQGETEMAAWYKSVLQPALQNIRPSDIVQVTGLSTSYAVNITHADKIPHPRLYLLLAQVAEIDYPFPL